MVKRAFPVVLLLLSVSACATKGDVRNLQEDIRELHQQQQALLQELQREQRAQRDSVQALAQNVQQGRAETSRRMTNLEDHLLRVQELTGLSQQQLSNLRDELERERTQLAFGPPPSGPSEFDPAVGMAEGGEGATELYDAAVTQFRRGAYSSARMGFRELVDRFPNDPLAPEARYYLADILVQEDERGEAIEGFLDIPEYHPDADRVPDALYRVAMLHLEMGDEEEAVQYLERVVNTWPDSGAANLARDELEEL